VTSVTGRLPGSLHKWPIAWSMIVFHRSRTQPFSKGTEILCTSILPDARPWRESSMETFRFSLAAVSKMSQRSSSGSIGMVGLLGFDGIFYI
jgi:hypothetical protein